MLFEAPEMDRRTLLKTLGTVAAGAAFSKYSVAAAPGNGEGLQRAVSHCIHAVYAGRQAGLRVP